jgi:hypothetical protein
MKVYLTLLYSLGITITCCFAQNEGSTIKTIDGRVKNILAALDGCEKKERVKNESGSNIVFTCEQEKVVQIHATDNNINKEVMWVYLDDVLIYSEQLWRRGEGETIDHQKFYFDKKEMIAWLKTDGSFVNVNSDEFIDLGKEILTQSKRLVLETE